MQFTTKFNIGNRVFWHKNGTIYSGLINAITIVSNFNPASLKDSTTTITYDISGEQVKEQGLFLSADEVKESILQDVRIVEINPIAYLRETMITKTQGGL